MDSHHPGQNNKKPPVFLSVLIAVVIVLVGYHKIFFGHNFFVHEDWVAVSNHTAGNKFSNGWRPDKGLGLSYFYGDPAMWHPWSLLTFWERLLPDRTLAYTISVLFLDIAVVISWLFFIRRFFPKVNPTIAALLVPLAIFCFDASAQHYARAFISMAACIPLGLWVMFEYYHRPRWLHVCLMAFLWWVVAFTGTLWSLTQLLMLGFVFSLFYMFYLKVPWSLMVKRFLLLHVLGLTVVVFMGAWVFYAFGLDQVMVGYAREKPTVFHDLKWLPEIKSLFMYLFGFIPFTALPLNHDFAAFRFIPYFHGASVVFIFIFLHYLGKRSADFWEFALKGLLAVFFIHGVLDYGKLIPAYSTIYGFISSKTSKLISMYGFVYCLQVLLIVLYVATVNVQNIICTNRYYRSGQVFIAAVTVFLYVGALSVAGTALLFPEQYLQILRLIGSKLPDSLGGYSRELLGEVLSYNARRFQALVSPELLMFFSTSIVIAGVFLRDQWLRWAAGVPKAVVAVFLVLNSFLLAWSIYPLNNRPLAWDEPGLKKLAFEPTDRFYFVRLMDWEKTPDGFRLKYINVDGGFRKSQIGLLEPPGLNLSGFKSFTSRAEFDFINRILQEKGLDYKRLYYGMDFVTSPLLDMSAVKYYYSDGPIKDRPYQITPFAQVGQVHIYKNNAAWPYYWLAKRIEVMPETLRDPARETAYLMPKDMSALETDITDSAAVRLTDFEYGRLKFDVDCDRPAFLVVADSWHPFWKARNSNGEMLKVIKANEVFKGVRLPAGKYQVEMYFDTRPYLPGVWVSLAAWMLWVLGFIWAIRDRREVFGGAQTHPC